MNCQRRTRGWMAWAAFLLTLHLQFEAILADEPPAGIAREVWGPLLQRRTEARERLAKWMERRNLGVVDQSVETATRDVSERRAADRVADAGIFLKGIDWALEFDVKFEPQDVVLLQRSFERLQQRLDKLERSPEKPNWTQKRGKVVRGFVSRIDGSLQPYGMIVPAGYDGSKPMRLDVVLHGSTRPVGISELRFMDRFDAGDQAAENETLPDVDYLELHPLGRVENGYRWAGETDVLEAIDAACRQYRVDRDRVVLRGMSMGASGTWHLGLKHPDRFVALGPYCGYVDTHRFSETPLPNFVRVGPLPPVQETTLRLLDSYRYAANAVVTPAIACMGEKDVFFDAHVIMGKAMKDEGLEMVNLISPGTGHVIDPETHREQMRRIAEYANQGLNHGPKSLRFVTWSLKYSRCHWLRVLQLQRHYERTEFVARLNDEGELRIEQSRNIERFAIDPPMASDRVVRVVMGGQTLSPPPRSAADVASAWVFFKEGERWNVKASSEGSSRDERLQGKRPGLQGPIDDAFTDRYVCVRGTGTPWNPAAAAAAEASLRRFEYEWRRYFRGAAPVVNDTDVDAHLLASANLILFGDPGSNRWMREALPKLAIQWNSKTLTVAGKEYASAEHLPVLIAPGQVAGAEDRYWVFNSGHSFHEPELSTLNYLLYPRLGDWAVLKVGAPRVEAQSATAAVVEEVVDFGLSDEMWRPIR